MAVTYLDKILARHRAQAERETRSLDQLLSAVKAMPPTRGFTAALAAATELAVISEVKRRSPSKGDLFVDLDPASLANTYQTAGATCISVLTDTESFGGSTADLQAARAAVRLPVLRKDFTMSLHDIADTRLMGADCVLLIAAALDPAELIEFHQVATDIGLDVLVEIHDEAELEMARSANATLIGVNQRDLVTFQVDHQRALRLAGLIGDTAVTVAESGVRGRADAQSLRAAGYDAVLVGETLVTASDTAAALRSLIV